MGYALHKNISLSRGRVFQMCTWFYIIKLKAQGPAKVFSPLNYQYLWLHMPLQKYIYVCVFINTSSRWAYKIQLEI